MVDAGDIFSGEFVAESMAMLRGKSRIPRVHPAAGAVR
jgi:hypothetical protein